MLLVLQMWRTHESTRNVLDDLPIRDVGGKPRKLMATFTRCEAKVSLQMRNHLCLHLEGVWNYTRCWHEIMGQGTSRLAPTAIVCIFDNALRILKMIPMLWPAPLGACRASRSLEGLPLMGLHLQEDMPSKGCFWQMQPCLMGLLSKAQNMLLLSFLSPTCCLLQGIGFTVCSPPTTGAGLGSCGQFSSDAKRCSFLECTYKRICLAKALFGRCNRRAPL